MPDRATGKTFRAVLRALADASEGKDVIFVSRNRRDTHASRYAYVVTQLTYVCTAWHPLTKALRFKTAGEVRFTDLDTFQREVREGRHHGRDRHRFKVVFDDCGPDEYTEEFLRVRAHG